MPSTCPVCTNTHDGDGWPVTLADGSIVTGGCQDCWEGQCATFVWPEAAGGK